MINVDTDMIIPKQYLKTIKRTGLGTGLFSEKRYKDDGSENPDFVLNKPAYRKAKILVAGDNFGCGSSREHAPWALMDFGIRCVISTSFGDIFYNNCFKNGVLPIKVSPEDLEKLFDDAERGANATLSIDLEKQEIRGPDGGVVKFDIDAHRKHCLLNGLDDIGLTMVKGDKIESFEQKAKAARAWADASSRATAIKIVYHVSASLITGAARVRLHGRPRCARGHAQQRTASAVPLKRALDTKHGRRAFGAFGEWTGSARTCAKRSIAQVVRRSRLPIAFAAKLQGLLEAIRPDAAGADFAGALGVPSTDLREGADVERRGRDRP